MTVEIALVHHGTESPLDLHLARLTEFSGIQPKLIDASDGSELDKLARENPSCVMLSARSLAAVFEDDAIPKDAVTHLLRARFVFVYGITPGVRETQAVRNLTDGLISSVISFDRKDYPYQVSTTAPHITAEFSGLAFGPSNKEIDFGLIVNRPHSDLLELVCVNKLPTFACLKRQQSSIFLLACRDIADTAAAVDGSLSAAKYFSRLVPCLMFLRCALGEKNWHNPSQTANVVIDDPLLRRSYGFLDYSRLLREMDRTDFTSTIAFIPWNYARTDASTAKLIRERSDRFQICVHGCDHTQGEFASTDVTELNARVHLATHRMRLHEQRTGVPYSEVMVFPQGKFSFASISLLKSHNFLAAVNSSVIPADLCGSHGLSLADLLQPAVCKYSTFPLLMRRYLGEVADLALDLFLGKPALLVQHHGDFKNGYDEIREFIIKVNSLSKRLQWSGLQELVKRTYLQKRVSPDTMACKIFGNRHIVRNAEPTAKRYLIVKPEGREIPIRNVAVNGSKHPYELEDGYLRMCIDIPADTAAEIAIDYCNTHPYDEVNYVQPLTQHFKVYLRRYLSELRDNYLAKNDRLLSLAYRLKDGKSFDL